MSPPKPTRTDQHQALQALRHYWDSLEQPTGRLVDSRAGHSLKVELYLSGTPVEVWRQLTGAQRTES